MSGIPKAQIGDKYGYLTIIADTGKRTSQGDVIWKFRCDCGNVINRRFDTVDAKYRKRLAKERLTIRLEKKGLLKLYVL